MADQEDPDNPEGQQPSSAKQDLRQDELVDRLMPHPSQQQPLTVLSGFLGRSPEAGHWRLYLTPTFDEYVEISEENIVHSQPLEQERSPLGGTMVWVRSGTPLQYTRTISRQIQAEFLRGDITAALLSSSAMQGQLGARELFLLAKPSVICTHPIFCTNLDCPSKFLCPTDPLLCPPLPPI